MKVKTIKLSDIVNKWLVENGYPQTMIDKFEKNNTPFSYHVWYDSNDYEE